MYIPIFKCKMCDIVTNRNHEASLERHLKKLHKKTTTTTASTSSNTNNQSSPQLSAVMTGPDSTHPPLYRSPQFQYEFPSLSVVCVLWRAHGYRVGHGQAPKVLQGYISLPDLRCLAVTLLEQLGPLGCPTTASGPGRPPAEIAAAAISCSHSNFYGSYR